MRQTPIQKKNNVFTAHLAYEKFCQMGKSLEKKTVIDVGCGKLQQHAEKFKERGFETYTCDFYPENDYRGMFIDIDFDKQFDMVWSAHVLEHQENVGLFLKKLHSITKEDGLICITVPPARGGIVGGHLTLWNMGLLYYNMILAGFDCSKAIHKSYGYNLSVIAQKKTIKEMPDLYYDNGDIELLSKYFPFKAVQGFAGDQLRDTF